MKTDVGWRFRTKARSSLCGLGLGAGLLCAQAVDALPFTQTAAVTRATASDFAGWSVAVGGDWMLVGAPAIGGGPGNVYVYRRNNADGWDYYATITSPDAATGDRFGAALAMDGETIVIGSPTATSAGNANGGRAYLFRHTIVFDPFPPYAGHDAFVEVAELLAPTVDIGNESGFAVAVNGDIAVVGAPYAPRRSGKATYAAAGFAAVFQRNSGGSNAWGRTVTAVGDLDANDNFGYAVAVSGASLLIGAPGARVTPAGTTYHSGRAYFFLVGQNDGSAVYDHYVGTATPAEFRRFGDAVAIDADVAAVGAPGNAGGYAASVDVFTGDGSGYQFTKQLTSPQSDTNPNDRYGAALAVHGPELVVGAPAETYASYTNAGEAYIYARDAGSANFWGLVQPLYLNDNALQNYYGNNAYIAFGSSIAYDGTTLVGGGPLASYSYASTGAAFAFSNDPIFASSFDCQPSVICL